MFREMKIVSHSVLRHRTLAQRFGKGDSMSLRQYLSSIVSTCFREDEVIQSLFEYEGVNYKDWCRSEIQIPKLKVHIYLMF